MAKRQTFYSFHFANDVMRVQQIRNMGVIDENEPVSPNAWEEVRRKGDSAIEQWIDENMKYRSCVVVLIGTETHRRPWVQHEIKKAWRDGKGLFGIHIHNLKCPRSGTCEKGANPFGYKFTNSSGKVVVPVVYDPPASTAYSAIKDGMAGWVEEAIAQRSL